MNLSGVLYYFEIYFCLDPDPELGKFEAGSGSVINHSGPTTLFRWIKYFVTGQCDEKKLSYRTVLIGLKNPLKPLPNPRQNATAGL